MELLRAAIAARKEKRKVPPGVGPENGVSDGTAAAQDVKRFRTKKEIEEERKLERLRQQQQQQGDSSVRHSSPPRAGRAQHTQQLDSAVPSSSASPPPLHVSPSESALPEVEPPVFEVKKRLRVHGHPITLFAESCSARWHRLKTLELELDERGTKGEGSGRNTFHEILTSEVESELKAVLLQEIEQAKAHHEHDHGEHKLHDSAAASSSAPSSHKRPHTDYAHVNLSLSDFPSPSRFIVYFLKRMLSEWAAELELRPSEVKRSLHGKVESATQKQTRQSLKPLLTLLKAQAVDPDILKHTLSIVQHCREGRWKEADEAYLTMAIGNAPWPMGVTMVGIHERSGREKIFSDHVAHVLNDETARKYIQSIKRIMTWCREHYPQGWGRRPGQGHGEEEQEQEGGAAGGADIQQQEQQQRLHEDEKG